MSARDWLAIPESERREFAEAFERAHAAGLVSDKRFARARIEGTLALWHMEAWEAAGRPELVPDNITDGRPPIESVGVPVIDKALSLTCKPAHVFLSTVAYLLNESDDALEIAERRAKDCDKAAQLLKEAAALLKGANNEPLAYAVEALAPWAERGKYGRVYPAELSGGYLRATQHVDALTAALKGKRGSPSRQAAIVRALVALFPDTPDFWSNNNGYALIAELSKLWGKPVTPQAVRSVVEQARRTAPEPKPKPRRDSSIIGLLKQ